MTRTSAVDAFKAIVARKNAAIVGRLEKRIQELKTDTKLPTELMFDGDGDDLGLAVEVAIMLGCRDAVGHKVTEVAFERKEGDDDGLPDGWLVQVWWKTKGDQGYHQEITTAEPLFMHAWEIVWLKKQNG